MFSNDLWVGNEGAFFEVRTVVVAASNRLSRRFGIVLRTVMGNDYVRKALPAETN
jgi:hypothetical protein